MGPGPRQRNWEWRRGRDDYEFVGERNKLDRGVWGGVFIALLLLICAVYLIWAARQAQTRPLGLRKFVGNSSKNMRLKSDNLWEHSKVAIKNEREEAMDTKLY